jgi:putative flippase GtrA
MTTPTLPQSPPARAGGTRLRAMRSRLPELFRFGSVGLLAFVVDLGVFNLMLHGPIDVLAHKPITVKVISAVLATLVAWLGNRYWTFASRRTANQARELVEFVAVNAGGLAIAAGCLAFSRYLLGLDSQLADNISGQGVGLVLGTVFRYVMYRRFVFRGLPHAS